MAQSPSNKSPFNFDWQKVVHRLTILISVGVIINLFIVYFLSGEFKLDLLLKIRLPFLFLALIFGILPMIIHGFEIKLWAHYFGLNLSSKDSFSISVSTILGSAVTPTMLGGGPVKWALLVHHGLKSGQAAAITTLSGLQDLCFLILIITFSIFASDRVGVGILERIAYGFTEKLPLVLAIIAGVVLLVLLLLYILNQSATGSKIRSKILQSMKDFKDAFSLIIKNGYGYFLLAVFTTSLRWMSRFMVVLWLVMGLSIESDYLEIVLSNWLVFTGMTAVPTPGAAGGAEGLFYLVYKPLIPKEFIGVVIFAWRFFTEYTRLIFAAAMVNFLGMPEKAKPKT